MSIATNDGGPAFPTGEEHGFNKGEPGMTRRDYFAAHAPISLNDAMVRCGIDANSFGMLETQQRAVVLSALSVMRGEYADAMISEQRTT